jgi:Mor family transcriptional regulator
MQKDKTYPEILADLADQIGMKLVGAGLDEVRAADIGFDIAEHVRKHWGKHPFYLPAGVAYELSLRDREIYERYDGHNHDELAKAYDRTVVRIYQIIKRVRTELFNERQRALF